MNSVIKYIYTSVFCDSKTLSEIFELGMVNSSSDNVMCWFITKSGYRYIGVNKNNFIDFLGKYIVEGK